MQTTAVAGALASACVLTACGFTPPKPPVPQESPHIAINKSDPRLTAITPATGNNITTPQTLTLHPGQTSIPNGPLVQDTNSADRAPTPHPKASTQTATPSATPRPATAVHRWHVDVNDGTVLQALQRWAHEAGWTFASEHWEVPWDVPIEASMDFDAESFEQAAQALSDAVTLSASPLLPCFDSNKVLRIIPNTQSCDPGNEALSP